MTVEQDIGELKTDIKWIKESLREMKQAKQMNKGYLIGLIGSMIISFTSIIIVVMR